MKSRHFAIHELVPPKIYKKYGEKAWRFVPVILIISIDTIKDRFPNGTMTINNYKWGGERKWSGLRTFLSSFFSKTSMHSFGNAIDAIFSAYDVEEVRQDIINNPEVYPHIKGLELNVTWLHADCRNEDTLVTFNA